MRNTLLSLTLLCVLTPLPSWAQKQVIAPPEFGRPGSAAPPFSPGILIDGTLYIAGQLGSDLKTRSMPPDFETEVKNCLDSIGIILKAAGMSYDDVVSAQVFLTDMSLFQKMNGVYTSVLKEPRPARTTVGVSQLAATGAHIEINMIARKAH